MARRLHRNASSTSAVVGSFLFVGLGLSPPADAQTVGPGTVTTTVNVSAGTTTIVGSTAVTTPGTTAASNVTGGTLIVDSAAGPSPGAITIQSVNGNALAANGGTISVINGNTNLLAQGGHAVLANGGTSIVTISNGASVQTTGSGTGLAAITGTINATGVIVNNTGTSVGHGAVAETGGTVNLEAGTSITTGGFNAVALGASGANSRVNANVLVPVTAQGRGSMGVYMHDGGQVSLQPNSVLQINGGGSVGITADNTTVTLGTLGTGLAINLDGASAAGQAASTGIVTVNGANLSIADVTIQGQNAAAGVWARPGTVATISGNSVININAATNPTFFTLSTPNLITTSGQVGSIFAVTSGLPIGGLISNAATINSIGTTITVTSNDGVGAFAGIGTGLSRINLTNNAITTTGTNSFGIEATSDAEIVGTDSQVTTSGGGAALFVSTFNGPGSIDLTDSTVLAQGTDTTGLFSLNLSSALTNNVRLAGGSLVSEDSTAIEAQGPLTVTITNGAVVTGGGGLLLDALANTLGTQATFVQINASNASILTGDAQADALSTANIDLDTASHWTGAALDVTNVDVDATSVWTMTANSNVTNQVTNAGLIDFTPPVGGVFKTLTTANYVGSDGTIGLNTFLDTDGSPSDKLVINGGSATGTGFLRITNAGGAGALTTGDGILVVEAINGGTTVPGLFGLAGPVAAGPYEYLLFRSSVDGTLPDNWYLRSTINCELDPTDPACEGPEPPPDFRPETSTYTAIPMLAIDYGRALLDTLHERVGEERFFGRDPSDDDRTLLWSRIIGQHGNHDGGKRGILGDNGPEFDYDIFALQAGVDLLRDKDDDGGINHAGIYGAYGHTKGDVEHYDGQDAGTDRIDAYTIGAYWTHFGPEGWYLDTIGQATWYDAEGDGRFDTLSTSGWGFAGSLEGGYPLHLDDGWIVEPQAQFVFQLIDLSDGDDGAADVSFDDIQSITGRLGARVAKSWASDDEQRAKTAWARASLWHEFEGDTRTEFSSEDGPVPFRGDLGGDTVELRAGFDIEVSKTVSLYASGGYDFSLEDDSDAYDGKGGVKFLW